MGFLDRLTGGTESRRGGRDERHSLLPTSNREPVRSAIPALEVTKVALKLKYQLENVIPCELEEDAITKAHSTIITPHVVQTASEAGGDEHKACVIYCLLICKKWFRRQAILELWDADMHNVRATACEVIAKRIIESEQDMNYLFEQMLLQRFSILIEGEETSPANALERAVDLHALRVIGSSGYQRCNEYLWRGWLIQDDENTSSFIPYENKTNTNYWDHYDPDRMRVPRYQNALQITFSIIFLGLYTGAINTINPTGDVDVTEWFLYVFTLGFVFEELAKVWKVGRYYVGFWNIFNSVLYILVLVSFILRMVALSHHVDSGPRKEFNILSYNFLAFTAPMFWMRLMLYLDTFRFFGAMLVVVKVMMKESIIFFALLAFVLVGFLQAFYGLVNSAPPDEHIKKPVELIVKNMFNAIMTSPEFDQFDAIGPPFGALLYYIYTFVIMVVLLNILIALYNSAYEDITGNATDEYMALYAQKTLQFARAPDENVYIAPLNLIEIFLLILPFEWWMPSETYERLNDIVMGTIYCPMLLLIAYLEKRDAEKVLTNRSKGEDDEDTVEEWEELDWKPEVEDEEWAKKVRETSPNVEADSVTLLVRELRKEVGEVRRLLGHKGEGGNEERSTIESSSSFVERSTVQKSSSQSNSGFGLG